MFDRYILINWIAVSHDPFHYREGKQKTGPTLNLLFNQYSPYKDNIDKVLILCQKKHELSIKKADETIKEIEKQSDKIKTEKIYSDIDNPIDHKPIYEFVEAELKRIRLEYPKHKLLINISNGTPSMHAVWLLLGITGFMENCIFIQGVDEDVSKSRKYEVHEVETDYISKIVTNYLETLDSVGTEDIGPLWTRILENAKSPTLIKVRDLVKKYAPITGFPILILGERGTGKSEIAEYIRIESRYFKTDKGKPKYWHKVACGQFLNENLLESEFFGYEKGAFTGAEKRKSGLLEEANNDHIFLDEIGDTSKSMQRTLIKAIEGQEFKKVGGETYKSSARFIFATNKPYRQLIKILDNDFFDRIKHLIIEMPPLREIREDLPEIWCNVWQNIQKRAYRNKNIKIELTKNENDIIIRKLKESILSGNIRDLQTIAINIIIEKRSNNNISDELLEKIFEKIQPPIDTIRDNKTLTKEILTSFLKGKDLNENLFPVSDYGVENLSFIFDDLKDYLAEQLFKLCRLKNIPQKDLSKWCGHPEQTLSKWKKKNLKA